MIRYARDGGIERIWSENSTISYPLHNHASCFVVGLVLGGAVTLTMGGGSLRCEGNRAFVIPPYCPHSIEAKRPYSLLTLCVPRDARPTDDGIRRMLAGLRRLTDGQRRSLTDALSTLNGYARTPAGEAAVQAVRRRLERAPEGRLSVAEMARAACMSEYHLIRRFKTAVGLTPHQFQMQNRVRKAQRMLGGAASITEVALSAGFCDQSHFIRCFKRYVGLTPTAYRAACRPWAVSEARE